jgi:hypothetical protein
MNELNWEDADLVLANSTCFDQSLLSQIAKQCSKLKKGAWMFTLTKKLPSAELDFSISDDEELLKETTNQELEWECVLSVKREMSWGLATVHIQRKIK